MDRPSSGSDRSASLQERYAARSICFGCGPANDQGLHVRSFPRGADDDECVCDWTPEPHHQAFPGVLNGGIIGTLMDCHSNWTAAYHLMRQAGADRPPTTVTADFHVRLLKPTPSGDPVHLSGRVAESTDDRATIETALSSGDVVTATCRGTFVAVRPGHPAYHRW
ncbi:MAG: PaaI family thioesterase [Chloroflexota bacterium]|nr:PaaI family thioesterase [Chloroflexota bacterium]